MIFWKSKNIGFVLFLAAMFGMYGCASHQGGQVTSDVQELKAPTGVPTYSEETVSSSTVYTSSEAPTYRDEMSQSYYSGGRTSKSGAFPTGDRATSVVFIEKSIPAQTQVGHPFDFITRVTNLTDALVKNVVVYGMLPDNYDVTSSDPGILGGPTEVTLTEDRVHWNIGDLDPRATKVITVSGSATSQEELEFCCTEVTYDYDPALCMTAPVVQPELQITKQAPSEVMICDTIQYRIVVSNIGTGAAQNVQINDPLPSGLSTVSGEHSVIRDIGTLNEGESREITVDVKADRTGTFDNVASAVASGDLSANSNSTSTLITQPVLTLTKTGPERRFIGRNITYNLRVTNEGNAPAVNTSLDDCIALNTTMVSASDGASISNRTALWDMGTLQPHESREVSVTVVADSMGEAKNMAVASAECADAATAELITIIGGIPAILLELIDLADPIELGGTETYEIRVTNQGTATDSNISIVCRLESGTMEFISSDGPTTSSAVGGTVTFAHLPSLAPKETATWRVNVRAVGEGDVRFGVVLHTDQLTRDVTETEATNFYR